MSTMFTITVPSTSANMGPCFDSAGIALNRYLTLTVKESDVWEITEHGEHLPHVAHYEDHFIYNIACDIADKYDSVMRPCAVAVQSNIPLARGLGSSASAVLAGIELANQVADLQLTDDEKLALATEIEGHPDNVAPALFGGIVVSTTSEDGTVLWQQISSLTMEMVVAIPDIELRTEKARNALPSSYTREQATQASSISNVMIAALLAENYELAGTLMEEDLFHEPYRSALIPHYEDIRSTSRKFGAYGTVISGAGPTMISFTSKDNQQQVIEGLRSLLPSFNVQAQQIDTKGLQVTYE